MERSEHDVRVELARRVIDDAIGRVVLDPKLADVTSADLVGILLDLARRQTGYLIDAANARTAARHGKATRPPTRRRKAEATQATPGDHAEAGTSDGKPTRPNTEPGVGRITDGRHVAG
jgi:hypothetical protein